MKTDCKICTLKISKFQKIIFFDREPIFDGDFRGLIKDRIFVAECELVSWSDSLIIKLQCVLVSFMKLCSVCDTFEKMCRKPSACNLATLQLSTRIHRKHDITRVGRMWIVLIVADGHYIYDSRRQV